MHALIHASRTAASSSSTASSSSSCATTLLALLRHRGDAWWGGRLLTSVYVCCLVLVPILRVGGCAHACGCGMAWLPHASASHPSACHASYSHAPALARLACPQCSSLLVISPLLLLLHGWLLWRLSLVLRVPLPLLRRCSLLVLLLLPLLLLGGKRRRHVGRYRFGIQLPYELQDFLRARSLARIIRKHICHTRKTNEKRE